MPKKLSCLDRDNICQQYISGINSGKIAKEFGVHPGTILRTIKEAGIKPLNVKPQHVNSLGDKLPLEDIISLYVSEVSEKAIAEKFNVSRNVIARILAKNGIERRGKTCANRIMMSKRSRAENVRNTLAANNAVRGKPQPKKRREKAAKTLQIKPVNVGNGEVELVQKLRFKGFNVTPQKAFKRYNLDIAFDEFPIAVEVFGGGWHTCGNHARRFRERFDDICNAGIIPVIVWTSKDYPISDGIVEYLVSLTDRISRGETFPCQEHVLWGNGKPCSVGKDKLKYNAFIGGDKSGDLVRSKNGSFSRQAIGM